MLLQQRAQLLPFAWMRIDDMVQRTLTQMNRERNWIQYRPTLTMRTKQRLLCSIEIIIIWDYIHRAPTHFISTANARCSICVIRLSAVSTTVRRHRRQKCELGKDKADMRTSFERHVEKLYYVNGNTNRIGFVVVDDADDLL